MHRGLHLTIDGIVSDPSRVFSHENLENLFKKLVKKIDMLLIYGPVFMDVPFDPKKMDPKVFKDEGGTSAFCMINCSHISLHSWTLRGVFQMDIFSCAMFDKNIALKVVKEELGVVDMKVHEIIREQLK